MKDWDFLKEMVKRGGKVDDGYFQYAHIVACELPRSLHEQLEQLVNGPIFDGDIASKADRGELFDLGLAVRVCYKGEQGYTGATYFAYVVNKTIIKIRKGEIGA